jgi:hypothetical protein
MTRSTLLLAAIAVTLGLSQGVAFAGEPELPLRQHPFLQFDIEDHRSADISLADMDGDGDLDVVLANGRHWAQQDYIFFNSGNGKLLEAAPLGDRKAASYTVQVGDLDGDGDGDAVVVRDMLPVLVFLNDGQGSLTLLDELSDSAGPARSADLVDLDDDGALDLVVVTRRSPDRVYRGTGDGRLSKGTD